jgi:flagellar protein FlbD
VIQVTRLNHLPLILNSDLIEHIEATPDTVVSLTTGQKIVVLESAEEIVARVIAFRRAIFPFADRRESELAESPSHTRGLTSNGG